MRCLYLVPMFLLASPALAADAPERTAKEAYQPFNDLVGSWKGTGTPVGSREVQQQGFWIETIHCEWQFVKGQQHLAFAFEKGKHFQKGELRYDPKTDAFQVKLTTPTKETHVYQGALKDKSLTLTRTGPKDEERLVFTFLHSNRFLYRYESRPVGKVTYTKHYQVGATKEGEPFAVGSAQPECIVSGGAGTSSVLYQGKTYYVCCSGCRAEFLANPEQYINEAAAKAKKK